MSTTIGKQLQERREQLGLTLADAAYATRLPIASLRRLEAEDVLGFGGVVYARGDLRLYSRFLNVDASLADAQLRYAAEEERKLMTRRRCGHALPAMGPGTNKGKKQAPVALMAVFTFLTMGAAGWWMNDLGAKVSPHRSATSKNQSAANTSRGHDQKSPL